MPELPAQASPRARAAVAASAQLHVRISERIQAIQALPTGPDREAAMNQLMVDFGDMFHLVSDAVRAAANGSPQGAATGTATGTATATETATATATPTPTATATATANAGA